MKANNRLRLAALSALIVATALVGACSEPPAAPSPTPAPAPPPAPAPAPPPPLPRSDVDWRTAPVTPGDWEWSQQGTQSVARFAGGQLVLSCDPASRRVTMLRSGSASGLVAMTVVTSNAEGQLTGEARPGPPPAIAHTFAASDPMLDAMAFSRGRFALEVAGLPTLYVPSWPEISRVIEDCR